MFLPSISKANFLDNWLFDDGINLNISAQTIEGGNPPQFGCTLHWEGYYCQGSMVTECQSFGFHLRGTCR